MVLAGGRATGWPMGPTRLLTSAKLRMPVSQQCGSETAGDKLRASRGKQPRSPAKAPKRVLSGKGCAVAKTTRRLA